jgi:hypothetical protein
VAVMVTASPKPGPDWDPRPVRDEPEQRLAAAALDALTASVTRHSQ